MSKFDCIVALGCSFVAGSNINDSDGNFVGDKYRASKLLSEHFKSHPQDKHSRRV